MKFLADVNVPQSLIQHLTDSGHHVIDVKNTTRRNSTDSDLRKWAAKELSMVLTYDKDFIIPGEIPQKTSVIVLHFPNNKPIKIIPYLELLLKHIAAGKFISPFIIILSLKGIDLVNPTPIHKH